MFGFGVGPLSSSFWMCFTYSVHSFFLWKSVRLRIRRQSRNLLFRGITTSSSLLAVPPFFRCCCWEYLFFACYTAVVQYSWNVMAHAQKPDFVFRRNGRVHLNRRGLQFSRLLAAELCASAIVMVVILDTPRSEIVATHSIRQFPFHFPSRASPCAITFQLESTDVYNSSVASVQSLMLLEAIFFVHHTLYLERSRGQEWH
jgi:hypothetical protein